MEKYELNNRRRGTETTASTHRDFCCSLYLSTTGITRDKLDFSPIIIEELKYHFDVVSSKRFKEMKKEMLLDELKEKVKNK